MVPPESCMSRAQAAFCISDLDAARCAKRLLTPRPTRTRGKRRASFSPIAAAPVGVNVRALKGEWQSERNRS